MEKKYLKYSIEDFTQDKKFIRWVKTGLDADDWQNFIKDNSNLKKDIEVARKIIDILKTNSSEIKKEAVSAGWKNVEHFYNLYHRKQRSIAFKKFLRYAAIFVIALSLGATIPYFYFKTKSQQFSEIMMPADVNEAKLILADGAEIILKEKQSTFQFNAEGNQIKMNNDSIINYDSKKTKNTLSQLVLPYGMIKSDLILSDGTRVWLNAGSTFIFPQKFEGKGRKVFLKGEAYFEVAENKNCPFIVNANELNIEVLGTEFNLKNNLTDDELEVVLVKGAVSLRENNALNFLGKETKLKPKQRAVYNKMNNTIEVTSNIDTEYYTSWKEGLLQFNRESILNVFKRLSRFYNVRFVTERNVELHRKISGKLDLKETLDDVLKVVSDAAPISYRIEKDKVYVYEKIYYLPMKQ